MSHVEIVENLAGWEATFREGWLAHFEKTGETKWDLYNRPNNKTAPGGPAIDLSKSRLGFITTSGAYLDASQEPFDAPNLLGDYTIRTFPTATPFSAIAYAHTHYDHTAVNEDPQVLMPLRHLESMVGEGIIGELAPAVISFCGYQPDVGRVVRETIPAVVAAAKAEAWQAALLVPA